MAILDWKVIQIWSWIYYDKDYKWNNLLLVIIQFYIDIKGLILGLHPDNERRFYRDTASLISWAQT